MNLILFAIIHIVMGYALIYTYGKLPKAIAAFAFVFLTMSFLYWGAVLINFAN
ncbi:hypothetical protein [Cytobacillus firmus]|uniref:hypothetical protein n=1 Tax=Cytobacillus firmus TaxID=1399 RepID=UPI0018CCC5E9|nr:hypothetical protein [Cytobacillus firmus]URT71461.1 hypothetical protein NAF01_03025 [Cytobacillus firmus]